MVVQVDLVLGPRRRAEELGAAVTLEDAGVLVPGAWGVGS